MTIEENLERRKNEEEDRRLYGRDKQILMLYDIYTAVFQIYGHIESVTKDINLTKVLLALYYKDKVTQSDIARDYKMPLSTVATIVAKYKTGNSALITVTSGRKKTNSKILKLTEQGKKKAEQILNFVNVAFNNIQNLDHKSTDVKYRYLSMIFEQVGKLCNYTIGKRLYTEKHYPTV